MLETLINLIKSVPNVIWSAIIASAITLSGVLVSNRSNTNRLSLQLKHDAEEKAKERMSNLRKEVYLEAAEEIASANIYIGSLTDKISSNMNIADGLESFFRSAAKLELVAEPQTAILANKLTGTYGELLLRLMEKSIPLIDLKADLDISNELLEKAQENVNRVFGKMAEFNESAQDNERVFSALTEAAKMYQEEAKSHSDESNQLREQVNEHAKLFCEQVLSELALLSTLSFPVLVELRKEVGLTTDISKYNTQSQEISKKIVSQIDSLMTKLKDG